MRTITRIVGVIPTPVRALVGALLALALGLALRSCLAARRARRLERQRAQLLQDVGLLQAALLPVVPARLGPVATSAAYRPAEGPGAGGDFYDVFALPAGGLSVIVGDVSGHGRGALPHTALVRFTLRAYLEAGLSPREALQTAGAVLERQLGESFVTAVAATYDPGRRLLSYSCAGHPPPLVLGSRAIRPVTACASPPIGVGMRTGTRQTILSLPGAAQVCFHTDGLTEARLDGELYGSDRLRDALLGLGNGADAPALLERISEATDARPDDMAACLLSIPGDARAPQVLCEQVELDRDGALSARALQFLTSCGLAEREAGGLLREAAQRAQRDGTALLEVRLGEDAPEAMLQANNFVSLHAVQARRTAALGGRA